MGQPAANVPDLLVVMAETVVTVPMVVREATEETLLLEEIPEVMDQMVRLRGGGGGGAASNSTASVDDGGDGADGKVVVKFYG